MDGEGCVEDVELQGDYSELEITVSTNMWFKIPFEFNSGGTERSNSPSCNFNDLT